jgi:hypothetical protein
VDTFFGAESSSRLDGQLSPGDVRFLSAIRTPKIKMTSTTTLLYFLFALVLLEFALL